MTSSSLTILVVTLILLIKITYFFKQLNKVIRLVFILLLIIIIFQIYFNDFDIIIYYNTFTFTFIELTTTRGYSMY